MSFPARSQFLTRVVDNKLLCREHYRLVVAGKGIGASRAGQFVQVLCREPHVVDAGPLLRRPFSLAGRLDRGDLTELTLIHRVVGIGTGWLAKLKVGDEVSVIGPLGNGFELPRAGQRAILVGGGVGIPPMLYLAEALGGNAVAFVGATTRDLLPLTLVDEPRGYTPGAYLGEFNAYGIPSVVTTDDGSCGFGGYVTQALERYLDEGRISDAVIYTCGPEPMMKRVAQIAIERGLECQVAAERAMACGMGTCQSCCIKVKAGRDWIYKLACKDGPVFAAETLLW